MIPAMKIKILTTKQAAERLGVSVRRVQALITAGTLKALKLGREYAIEESALSGVKVYGKRGRPPATKGRKRSAKKQTEG